MFEQLHWLPLTARIQLKVLVLICRSYVGLAPKYLCDSIRRPTSAVSHCPLRSLDLLNLFVPRVRTAIAQSRAFACIGPSQWNQLPPFVCTTILCGGPVTSFRYFETCFYSRGLSHWERL